MRELRNAVERLIIMTLGDKVDAENLPAGLGMALGETQAVSAESALIIPHEGVSLQEFKDRAEREFLLSRLDANDWNIAATAKAIDTPRSNLYKKLDAYGISREKEGRS